MGWGPTNVYVQQDLKYQWRCRGENCPYCDAMDGRVYSLDVYMTSGVYPGFHKGCNCYLVQVPSYTLMSDLDIFGSALNMRNDSWLNALFGRWENLWVPGWYTNPHNLLSMAKPGTTAGEALALFNASYDFGMFTDYGFPGNMFYAWNTNKNVNKSSFRSFPEIAKDIYTGVKQMMTGEFLASVLTSKIGLTLTVPQFKPLTPAQTYHNTYYRGWGR